MVVFSFGLLLFKFGCDFELFVVYVKNIDFLGFIFGDSNLLDLKWGLGVSFVCGFDV